ncbi:GSCOCT00014283001.2-RA-CDS [Cotesia congregata]|uniref:Cc_single_3.7 n=2 Tax=root TaxID=1 RepID=S6CWI6_COTCN|nr:hypothetical protein CcBV_3.7 [Bracoviriform congregatae]CAD6243546.1 GSCOCT00014283001.2-RA-CDS [Cotesia congregata]CAG17401.1 hypothetical protein CcBV_3.7 [Bracoviriform congregatae]CAG5092450.1 cc_single_3.7 [Cotesia congregata]CAG5107567.1 cc_single_3.7 [Cotesia congregata]CCQ71198.1 hypothetical protein CcBV_3.7 [Cotesia congregata]
MRNAGRVTKTERVTVGTRLCIGATRMELRRKQASIEEYRSDEAPSGVNTREAWIPIDAAVPLFSNTTINIDDSWLVSTAGAEVTKNCREGPLTVIRT